MAKADALIIPCRGEGRLGIDEEVLMRRLEQLAALVVAAGLALVSYWLFFSWAGGGGARDRQMQPPPSPQVSEQIRVPLVL